MNNIYYVYMYFDPTTDIPFYVGKGCGNRYKIHLTETDQRKCKNLHKVNKIKKLISNNTPPKIIFCDTNMSNEQANELEIFLIKEIGRADLGLGPLTNLTDGGEGTVGAKRKPTSQETREKMSKAHSGTKHHYYGKHRDNNTKTKIQNYYTQNRTHPRIQTWVVIDPDGNKHVTDNLKLFSEVHNVKYRTLIDTARTGKYTQSGWLAEKISSE